MNNIVRTKSVGKDFAKTNGILLEETATTALVFFPDIHPKGVRGNLIRFKKEKDKKWEKIPEQDFRKLQLYEGTHIELGTKQLELLMQEIAKRKKIVESGMPYGEQEYIVADKNTAIFVNDANKKNILQQVLDNGYSDEFWQLVSSSHPNLADKLSSGHLQFQRKKVIDELKNRLQSTYPETSGEESWQKWIYRHNWLFGANYRKPIEKQKINLLGIMPDYLFPTADGFVDILEIKLPSFEVIEEDKNHKGSWIWSKESNLAIGQVVNYLAEIERLRLEIERLIGKEFSILKPRAYILIGRKNNWSDDKKEGLRKLNYSLHGIEILTYSDLIKRGDTFIAAEDYSHEEE